MSRDMVPGIAAVTVWSPELVHTYDVFRLPALALVAS